MLRGRKRYSQEALARTQKSRSRGVLEVRKTDIASLGSYKSHSGLEIAEAVEGLQFKPIQHVESTRSFRSDCEVDSRGWSGKS